MVGWRAVADQVGAAEPGLGSFLHVSADLLQSALDARIDEFSEGLSEILGDAGIASAARAKLALELAGDPLPLAPADVAEAVRDTVADLDSSQQVSLRAPHDEGKVAAILQLVYTARLPTAWREVLGLDPDDSRGAWWAQAALEQPSVLGSKPVHCLSTAHESHDHIRVDEVGYVHDRKDSLDNSDVRVGPVDGGYSEDLEHVLVDGCYRRVDPPAHNHWYAIRLISEPSPTRRKVLRQLEARREQLTSLVKRITDAAVQTATMALSGDISLMEVLGTLAGDSAGLITDVVTDRLVAALTEPTYPSWGVLHTTVYAGPSRPDLPPLSAVVPVATTQSQVVVHTFGPHVDQSYYMAAAGRAARANTHYAVRDNPDLMCRARIFTGPSQGPPNVCDDAIWDEVARVGQPVVWADPYEWTDYSAFRSSHILFPHKASRGNGLYVSAVRIQVGLEPAPA